MRLMLRMSRDPLEWIELYNLVPRAWTEGYTLTDDSDIPHKWHFPSVSIPGFLLVWTTGYDIHDNTETIRIFN